MHFGYNLSTAASPGADPAADAVEAEALGYDFLCASDHLHGAHATFETWTMLTWVAAATSRVRIVSNVLGLPYRAPAVLAKMAETLQRFSGGRLALGLGAGGMDHEFEAFGFPHRSPGEKIDALEDALFILHGLWTSDVVTYEGRQYQVHEAELAPKPTVRIPVWIGANGPRALALTGRMADGWIPSLPFAPPETVPERRDTILAAAELAGRDPSEFTFVYNVSVSIGATRDDPRLVGGTADQVADRLRTFGKLGFDAINIWPVGHEPEQRHRIATEVLPLLR